MTREIMIYKRKALLEAVLNWALYRKLRHFICSAGAIRKDLWYEKLVYDDVEEERYGKANFYIRKVELKERQTCLLVPYVSGNVATALSAKRARSIFSLCEKVYKEQGERND